MKHLILASVALLCVVPAHAEDPLGDLNPEELSINRVLRDIGRGETSMTRAVNSAVRNRRAEACASSVA